MRTLETQVKLRRLIRNVADAQDRLESEPVERLLAGVVVDRLLELAQDVRQAWRRESRAGRLDPALEGYAASALRTVDLAIAGMGQAGADLDLLRADLDGAALPLEVFLRGLDGEPVLERSA
jgi:hypothetical protein